jgi:hypothetical protein
MAHYRRGGKVKYGIHLMAMAELLHVDETRQI